MRYIALILVGLVFLGLGFGSAVVFGGVYDVGATSSHWPVTYWLFDQARVNSIKSHARGIVAPTNLAQESRIIGGISHFATHCASCHSAPGVPAEEIAEGMYPKPPSLTDSAKRYTPSELFWIVKNGIKMSGMPSWNDHGDEKLWNIVAFLEKLPNMDAQTYQDLINQAEMSELHHTHEHGMRMPMPWSSQ